MRILDWYIARIILATTALTLLTLTGLSSIIKWVDQLRLIGQGDYQILDAMLYSFYLIPRDIEMFFPMAVLLGALMGMGVLAQNSELVVMQAAGLSRLQIVTSVMKTAVPLMVVIMAMSEWVAPEGERIALELRTEKISGGSLIKGLKGTWAKDGDNFVNINEVEDIFSLRGVTQYKLDDQHQLKEVIFAEKAQFNNNYWQLENVTHSFFSMDKIEKIEQETGFWVSSLTPDKLSVVSSNPKSLSISGLLAYLEYLEVNKQDPSHYQLALWRKLMQPVIIAVMMLMALSFVFSPIRTSNFGARMLIGMAAGFGYFLCSEVFATASLVFQLPPILGAMAPSVFFTMLAIWLLKKA
ncbi:LPS export ABC transporter permease LptG [Paraferrimonas sp. SM1919]|uniref:LPS export ABC transporter permease LptG n=1 Tax=Paraferrimonas sp. SM1919 TaxID=2662263 RepID=UPI0013D2E8B2|nr:LPS export ABC transporter permease LptG [Paraferrimonas sp. SM1919]